MPIYRQFIAITLLFTTYCATAFDCGKSEYLGAYDGDDIPEILACMETGNLNALKSGFRVLENVKLPDDQAEVIKSLLAENGEDSQGLSFGLLADYFLSKGEIGQSHKYAKLGITEGDPLSRLTEAKLYLFGYNVDQDIPKAMRTILNLHAEGFSEATKLLHKIKELESGKEEADILYSDMPINYSNPEYPRKAALKGISGYSVVKIQIDKSGIVKNSQVVESFPGKYFIKSSKRAAKKLRYAPLSDSEKETREFFYKYYYQMVE